MNKISASFLKSCLAEIIPRVAKNDLGLFNSKIIHRPLILCKIKFDVKDEQPQRGHPPKAICNVTLEDDRGGFPREQNQSIQTNDNEPIPPATEPSPLLLAGCETCCGTLTPEHCSSFSKERWSPSLPPQ